MGRGGSSIWGSVLCMSTVAAAGGTVVGGWVSVLSRLKVGGGGGLAIGGSSAWASLFSKPALRNASSRVVAICSAASRWATLGEGVEWCGNGG